MAIKKVEKQWLHDKVLAVIGSLYLCKLEADKFGIEPTLLLEIDDNIEKLQELLYQLSDDLGRTQRQLATDFQQREIRSDMTKYEGRE